MGRQSQLKKIKRELHAMIREGACDQYAAESAYRVAKGRGGLVVREPARPTLSKKYADRLRNSVEFHSPEEPDNFKIGMSIGECPPATGL